MRLDQLLESVPVIQSRGSLNMEVKGLVYRSQSVKPGDVFCTWKGEVSDGHNYINDAYQRGAVAFVVEKDDPLFPKVNIQVHSGREALGVMASNLYGKPSELLSAIGITGTNGKTSTAYLLYHLLTYINKKCGLLGTVEYRLGNRVEKATRTTPEGLDLQGFLADMVVSGCEFVIMEVASHALDQGRVAGISFDLGVFTNLTRDHLDYHKTMERYFSAKRKLFENLAPGGVAVINGNDSYGKKILESLPDHTNVFAYGHGVSCDYRAKNVTYTIDGTSFDLLTNNGLYSLRTPWIGDYNLSNALAAIASANILGIDEEVIAEALLEAPQVPGRMERISHAGAFEVIVDYAHTEDALRKALQALKSLTEEKLIVVVGCGGDRDTTKRPLMALAACEEADEVIFTSDNPRNENPADILNDMVISVSGDENYNVIEDREEAIATSIQRARGGDVILIAGKGHEAAQEVHGETIDFDDRVVALKYLRGFKK
ncbi:MAG: UDP-N-acetylmuramoyl-L-alanyl-D-glutamate--2,6-diaminopimelate ligase [Verrucomicrobiota bacterium]